MTTSPLPLNDFRVIDLTAHRAGPTAVRQLADWGAQVIKIEPSGELVDATGSRRDGPDFQNLHRNKRAMTLNLKSDEGRAIFFKLAERADVIVENYKSDVKHRLGIDYEAVKKVNPRIVYGSISGFGQDGPYAGPRRRRPDRPGHGRADVDHRPCRARPAARRHRDQRHLGRSAAVLWDRAGVAQSRAHRRGAMGPHLVARGADLYARLSGGALFDERRGRRTGGEFPSDLTGHRHVPDRRRIHQHRCLGR